MPWLQQEIAAMGIEGAGGVELWRASRNECPLISAYMSAEHIYLLATLVIPVVCESRWT